MRSHEKPWGPVRLGFLPWGALEPLQCANRAPELARPHVRRWSFCPVCPRTANNAAVFPKPTCPGANSSLSWMRVLAPAWSCLVVSARRPRL
ncbi:hypothetical protein N431DRAFT_205964 [Stipitochalara longipes BDJ]|nr:hypothetical protein N431DRAFT_205964 [Stipitochalara longipes BDJ]